ncbi:MULTISPECIES: GNAT family N-acetyltransferase [Polymorphospora]|uniref:GNAT family N-acetyltransferase n=1 Tax=Polymorphospora lycopeni TaxID=3140240 RepID=A0ABV5CM36_9ACTN
MEPLTVDYRVLGPGDVDLVLTAADLFDDPPRREWTERFLTTPGHHLVFAETPDGPVGFVTGVEMIHPDKGVEMFIYELGVAEHARDRGIGRGLVRALADIARAAGCYGMWTGTEHDNEPALRMYAAAGATLEPGTTIVVYDWSDR